MLLQIFKVEKNYFSIKGLKTKGLKNLAGEESVKESCKFDQDLKKSTALLDLFYVTCTMQ